MRNCLRRAAPQLQDKSPRARFPPCGGRRRKLPVGRARSANSCSMLRKTLAAAESIRPVHAERSSNFAQLMIRPQLPPLQNPKNQRNCHLRQGHSVWTETADAGTVRGPSRRPPRRGCVLARVIGGNCGRTLEQSMNATWKSWLHRLMNRGAGAVKALGFTTRRPSRMLRMPRMRAALGALALSGAPRNHRLGAGSCLK